MTIKKRILKKMVYIFTTMLFSIASHVSCGGTNEKWKGPIDIEELCDVYLNDLCISLIQCQGWKYRDMGHCIEDNACLGMDALRAEVDLGHVTYNAEAAGRCHRMLVENPCDFNGYFLVPNVYNYLEACGTVLTGNQSPNDPCVSQIACYPDASCLPVGVCPASCVSWAKIGESCDNWEGPRCDERNDLYCKDGFCRRISELGEACDSVTDCADYLWCDLTNGTCQALSGLGEPCNNFNGPRCGGDGLWCSSPNESGVCKRPASEGEYCLEDHNCDADLTCLPNSNDPFEPGVCGSKSVEGETCDTQGDCFEGLECSENYICSTFPGYGETCSFDMCSEGLVCEQRVCLYARYPGDACGYEDSVCVLSNCVDGRCKIRNALGEPCLEHTECSSSRCEEGRCIDPTGCVP